MCMKLIFLYLHDLSEFSLRCFSTRSGREGLYFFYFGKNLSVETATSVSPKKVGRGDARLFFWVIQQFLAIVWFPLNLLDTSRGI